MPLRRIPAWRHAILAALTVAALAAAPAAALAQQTYTIDVTATGGTLSGASAINASGQTVTGSVYGSGFRIVETSPGPFTMVGTGTATSGAASQAASFGETVSGSTYLSNLTLALPQVMPTEVTSPPDIYLTAGTASTVPISVYNGTSGAVSDGALVTLSPSAGLVATAGSGQGQVGQAVYGSTSAGTVEATLEAPAAGTYSLQLDSPAGSVLGGGTIPVIVSSPFVSSVPPPTTTTTTTTSSVGSTVTVDGQSGTVVLSSTFDADAAQTLNSSDGAVTLDIPAGAIASSGTVQIQIVEFNSTATSALVGSSQLPSYEQSVGISFDIQATVNGTVVHQLAAPVTATFSLTAVQGSVTHPPYVDLMLVNGSGSLTYVGGKWNGTDVTAAMDDFTPYALVEVDRTFPDITKSWAASDIELMASKFVVDGFPNGDFEPDGTVTRAQFTAMLLRMLNIPVDPSAAVTFTDVPSSAWYYGVVATAAEKGIVEGESSTTFAPNADITREDLVVMFVRAMELEGWATASQATAGTQKMDATFKDASTVDSYAASDMAIAVESGLVEGVTPDTLDPLGLTTRAQAATWVARLFNMFA